MLPSMSKMGYLNKIARFAGRAVPYVGMAATAMDVANAIGGSSKSPRNARAAAQLRRRAIGSGGRLRGPFKRSSKKGVKYLKKFTSHGFVDTEEIHGVVNDPDCIYLAHSAVDPATHIIMILKSLTRKLLKDGIGFDAENADQVFPVEQTTGQANALRFELVYQNVRTGVVVTTNCTSTSAGAFNTIQKVAQFPNFDVVFREYAQGSFGENDSNVLELLYYRLYMLDFAPLAENFRLVGQIDLRTTTLHVNVKSNMKIQNRTLSATGGVEADNVSNNPLIGYKYDFNSGTPVSRQTGAFLLTTMSVQRGVNVVRAAELPSSFREPPLPNIFLKCNKSARIRLQPGDIKYGSITYTTRMKLMDYLRKIGYAVTAFNADPKLWRTQYPIGKCQLYALEDVINVNGEQKINAAYEVNRTIGMYVTFNKKQSSIGQFRSLTYDNTA